MRPIVRTIAAMAVVLGMTTSAAAAAQSTTWVSVAEDGSGNGGTGRVAVSDDGRFVVFRSSEDDLVPGDTNGSTDVFVKDVQTGKIEIVSRSSGGTLGNDDSGVWMDISENGRFVVFDSSATNLVAGDTNDRSDIFVHDRQTDTTERVRGTDGSAPVGPGQDPAISADGRYVAFVGAGYEPGNDAGDWGVYVFDRQAGTSERVTDGVDFLGDSKEYADTDISDDGRFVAFTTGEFGSGDDVILFDRQSDTWEVANPRSDGMRPQTSTKPEDLALSGNGRFVAFSSPDTNYVPDTAGTNDVFVYDAQSNTLERIPGGGTTVSQDPLPAISDDGRFVAFISGADLYGAANGVADVVVYDRQSDSGEDVSLFPDGSPSNSPSGSYSFEPGISGDGRYVAFITDAEFDPDDPGKTDVYVVDREGAAQPPSGDDCSIDFVDVGGDNIFASDICWLAEQGITRGCNPPANTEFCPTEPVTRGQMAAFLVRALGYTDDGGGDLFTDDDDSVFERDIDRLGTAGVTRGCNPPVNDEFCPGENVTRGQMAAFLVRALGYTDDGGGDLFTDDDDSVFERDIDRLGTAGVTKGCNPPANTAFCPDDRVTRQQMAAFLRRALGG